MTAIQQQFWKNNVISLSTLITVLSFIVYQAKWQAKVDEHMNDTSVHIPFEKKIQIFVPRVEIDARLIGIEKALARIENKIN